MFNKTLFDIYSSVPLPNACNSSAQTYKTDELAHPGDNVLKLFVSVNYNDKLMHDVIQIVKIKLPRNGMSWWSSGQHAHHLLRQSEFESADVIFYKIAVEKDENFVYLMKYIYYEIFFAVGNGRNTFSTLIYSTKSASLNQLICMFRIPCHWHLLKVKLSETWYPPNLPKYCHTLVNVIKLFWRKSSFPQN